MKNSRLILSCFLLGISGAAYGQLELKTPERFNYLTQGPALGANDSQFGSVGITSGSAGPVSDTAPLYPQSDTIVLKRARIGNGFATGVPRYYLGDVVDQPAIEAPSGPGFWRTSPVRPGETFYNLNGANLVDVTGAQLPNTFGSSGTPIPALAAGAYEKFYYSPHADAVFATQAGTVEIWWVSALPQGASGGAYVFKKETFNVSGAATGAVRKIFWTEKTFNGPRVNIPAGRIVRVNPIYNSNFPEEVDEEFKPVGYVENPDPNARPPAETRTLWFEQLGGLGQLAAYNQEGRIFVEYLGAELAPGRHEFLGADVVEVVKAATIILETIDLGKQVLPKDGDTSLIGAPLFDLSAGSEESFYGTRALDNGKLVYYAERENLNPDLVVFYWLEVNDADISLLPESESPGLSIRWPKYQNRYFFVWPNRLDAYALVTTYPDGSTASTGIQFDPANQPEIIFQDDPAQIESSIDVDSQRLIIDLSSSLDGWNRTLLKFTNGNQVWYQPVYSQYEDRSETLETTSTDAATTTILTMGSTAGIEVGGIFAHLPDYSIQVAVESILDSQRVTVSINLINGLRIANGPDDYDYYSPPAPYSYFGTYNAVSKTVTTQKSLTVADTDGLTVGTLVSGPGINGTATIESIISDTEITLSQDLPAGSYELTYRVESDSTPPIYSAATVGTRVERPSDKYSLAGAVSGGTGYQDTAYLDPYLVGVEAAEAGAIIPVNALPTDKELTIRWFKRIDPPVPGFSPFYV
ncbi:MAG TPA: hypothetical protein VK995_00425, partial [Oceanipulchritudo sp.]|nr:hypothetical protein [Oceanipulchritudo sp.]